MLKRAWSTLTIKSTSIDGGRRLFTGIASTPNTDRMGDIVEPLGAVFSLPLPFLWMHDSGDPVGFINKARLTKTGIEIIEGEVVNAVEPASLKDYLDVVWAKIAVYKLVRGLSIGFNPIESARIDGTFGTRYLRWEWLELSAVTIPANQDATITTIKSIDDEQRAALGLPSSGLLGPGAAGHRRAAAAGGSSQSTRSPKGDIMKTIKELREERGVKNARMQELVALFKQTDHAPAEEELAEFDVLEGEVKQLDIEIRVASFNAINAASAKAVDAEGLSGRVIRTGGGLSFARKADPDPVFQGQEFVRLAICRAFARLEGNGMRPSDVAAQRWGKSHPQFLEWVKAGERHPHLVGIHTKANGFIQTKANEIAGGGTDSGEWGAELVSMDGRFSGDFIAFLTARTVFDRLPLRVVPANVTIKGQDGTATGYWVGQSKAIPASTGDFSTVNLTPLKVGALAVMSKDLVRYSDPAAEALVADALRDASTQRIDTTFLSTTAVSAGVSPAGLLNGVTVGTASGTDSDALRVDIQTLYGNFLTAKNSSDLYLVMQPALAKSIGLMVNSLGQTEFPGMGSNGGTLLGDPVVTGDNVGSGDFILLKPSDIWRIGDTGVEVSASDVATVEQSSAPIGATDTPTAMTQAYTSMFQEDSIAIKVVRHVNYQKRRTSTSVVNYIGNGAYGPISGS